MTPSYDLVFVGNVAFDEIHPFRGETHTIFGSAVYHGALATSWSDKRIALVTKMAARDAHLLEPVRQAGIAVYVLPSEETTYHRGIFPTENVDQREITLVRSAGSFTMADLPAMEPTLVNLESVTNRDFTVDFIRELRGRGFTCAVDMQSFVRHVDKQTGRVSFADVAFKQELASMAERVKLDVVEAEYLTGTADLEEAATRFETWGARETMVTRGDGVLVRHEGKSYFERFTSRTMEGRTGRGDTVFSAYLARRMDYGVADSLRFAAALTSIKLESPGPFKGTLEEVLERMRRDYSSRPG
jgi:sugar/nucleoside kinase (ribokinase family)